MSYHIIHIDSPDIRLNCRDGQLICRGANGEKTLPMEDIAAVVISSFSASIHSEVLLQAAEKGVAFIYCRNFKPVSLVLPASRATDTALTRAVIGLDEKARARLWRATVDAKCGNQYALAEVFSPGNRSLEPMKSCSAGRNRNKEATCAKYYWGILGSKLDEPGFTRSRAGGGINDLLNFGYAILMSLTLRNLFAVGLDPTFGIFHATRERATPLAYDLMEPFRPCVDARVCTWVRDHSREQLAVNAEFKKWIVPLPETRLPYAGTELSLRFCIERVVRSFRAAVLAGRPSLYKPWTLKNSKWAGCW